VTYPWEKAHNVLMLSRVILSVVMAAGPVPTGPPVWQAIRVHDYGGCDSMSRIVALDRDDVWVFGQSEPIDAECEDHAGPVAQHWDGSKWRTARLPGRIYGNISTAGASSADDVWAFTINDIGTFYALHFDGTRWKDTRRSDVPSGMVLGRHHVWGFGTRTWLWDGYAWRPRKRVRAIPYEFSVVSGTDAWGITRWDTLSHFDGSSWKKVALGKAIPADTGNWRHELSGVLGVSEKDVWVFGQRTEDNVANGGDHPLAAHFDGRAWSPVALPNLPGWHLGRAASDGAGGIRVIADPPGDDSWTSILSRSATGAWSVGTPRSGGKTAELEDLVRIPGTKEMWAAGSVQESDLKTTSAVFALR
jgi:hypothetical protein